MIREKLRRMFSRSVPGTIRFGEVSVAVPDVRALQATPIQSTEGNLRWAEREGIRPVGLADVLGQVGREVVENSVFFDTPPSPVSGGNHWRVVKIDPQRSVGTLQLCGIFGNIDYREVPPIQVSHETPMFTGISHQRFSIGGEPATLSQVVARVHEVRAHGPGSYPEDVQHDGEVIYWADSSGNLNPR